MSAPPSCVPPASVSTTEDVRFGEMKSQRLLLEVIYSGPVHGILGHEVLADGVVETRCAYATPLSK